MEIEEMRRIARDLECICEQDFYQLAGITPNTARSWRNRGRAPMPILLGTRYFYPISAIRQVIVEKTKDVSDDLQVVL
jgi:hypothetical protein